MNELIVFAKAPRAGQVKTRLGREIGDAEACVAYRELLTELGASMHSIGKGVVQFSPGDGQADLAPFFPPHWKFLAQSEGDLGARMLNALEQAFERGATRAAIIGSDCPYVTSADIEEAWRRLDHADAVFGPAEDGGYWLVGARRLHRDMFRDIAWGASVVLQQNVERCAQLGLSVELLRTLHDVDTLAEWNRYREWRGSAATST